MKYRILGSASGMPQKNLNHASVWIQSEGINYLLDCGEGTAQQLIKYNLSGDLIDYILISHFHPDHVVGLFMVLQMYYLQKRTKPLTLFLPENDDKFLQLLDTFYIFPNKFSFDLRIDNIKNLDLLHLKALPSSHLETYKDFFQKNKLSKPMKAYSFLLSEENKNLLYTSDIINMTEITQYFKNLDVLILDCIHPKEEKIISVAKEFNFRIILNHFSLEKIQNLLTKSKNLEKANEKKEYIL